jgi:four helix bundle protein
MAKSIIREKSFAFALKTIAVYRSLKDEHEYVPSKQPLRSGTSIGANVEEAVAAQSRKDFLSKMSIASKEARETRYWLSLLRESKLASVDVDPCLNDVEELIRILSSIVKSTAEDDPVTQNSKFKTQT